MWLTRDSLATTNKFKAFRFYCSSNDDKLRAHDADLTQMFGINGPFVNRIHTRTPLLALELQVKLIDLKMKGICLLLLVTLLAVRIS